MRENVNEGECELGCSRCMVLGLYNAQTEIDYWALEPSWNAGSTGWSLYVLLMDYVT